jgi:hypothetical protein
MSLRHTVLYDVGSTHDARNYVRYHGSIAPQLGQEVYRNLPAGVPICHERELNERLRGLIIQREWIPSRLPTTSFSG